VRSRFMKCAPLFPLFLSRPPAAPGPAAPARNDWDPNEFSWNLFSRSSSLNEP
jgi:hypothetical protein